MRALGGAVPSCATVCPCFPPTSSASASFGCFFSFGVSLRVRQHCSSPSRSTKLSFDAYRALRPPPLRRTARPAAATAAHAALLHLTTLYDPLHRNPPSSSPSLRSPPMPMLLALLTTLIAQKGPGRPTVDIICVEGEQAAGNPSKMNTATALLGAIGCTDPDAIAYRRTLPESIAGPPTTGGRGGTIDALATINIYGPFEAGFSSQQLACLGSNQVSALRPTLSPTLTRTRR